MVGDDDDLGALLCLFGQALLHVPNQRVQSDIPLIHDIWSVSAKHMLYSVQRVKDRSQHSLIEGLKLVEQYSLPRNENGLAQVEKLPVGDTSFFEGSSVLRPAKRQKRLYPVKKQ